MSDSFLILSFSLAVLASLLIGALRFASIRFSGPRGGSTSKDRSTSEEEKTALKGWLNFWFSIKEKRDASDGQPDDATIKGNLIFAVLIGSLSLLLAIASAHEGGLSTDQLIIEGGPLCLVLTIAALVTYSPPSTTPFSSGPALGPVIKQSAQWGLFKSMAAGSLAVWILSMGLRLFPQPLAVDVLWFMGLLYLIGCGVGFLSGYRKPGKVFIAIFLHAICALVFASTTPDFRVPFIDLSPWDPEVVKNTKFDMLWVTLSLAVTWCVNVFVSLYQRFDYGTADNPGAGVIGEYGMHRNPTRIMMCLLLVGFVGQFSDILFYALAAAAPGAFLYSYVSFRDPSQGPKGSRYLERRRHVAQRAIVWSSVYSIWFLSFFGKLLEAVCQESCKNTQPQLLCSICEAAQSNPPASLIISLASLTAIITTMLLRNQDNHDRLEIEINSLPESDNA
jgi:hypothetical protein